MYRNCVYNNKSKSIHLWTWDSNGNRTLQELDYMPYVYLEDKRGEDRSIFGTSLRKREFNTGWDRNKFIKETPTKRLFENLPPYQQFLIDNFYHSNGDEDFAKHPLKVMIIDIECPINGTDASKNTFPEPELAENIIDLLTCYDTLTQVYTVFGLKPYKPKASNVKYTHCKSEHDLLKRFIGHFTSDFPDCLVGWNSAGFDIPYIINRITFELGEDWAAELSPIGRIYEKVNKTGKFGAPLKSYVIEGISCIDYFILYKKFAMEPLESYKLDYVAEVELEENKIGYEGSLAELSIKDWETYVDYNLKDVELIVKLDDKLRYIELVRFISYLGLCNMENAINTVPVVNGAIAVQARHRGEKIPTFVRVHADGKIAGGHVAPPKVGFAKNIVSFDANSLYPSVMITGNMSPETKVGSVNIVDNVYNVRHVTGRTFSLSKENYLKYIKEEQLTRSESNILFSQKKKGIVPKFLDFLYSKRKEMKSKMFKLKRLLPTLSKDEQLAMKQEIQKCDTFQHAYKITLNSTYGYMVNKYAPLGDKEIGESVTLTGQSVIKKSNELVMEFLTSKYPELEGCDDQVLIYNDTDSCYLSLHPIEQFGVELMKDGEINQEFYDICDAIECHLNRGCEAWARKRLWSTDPRLVFKREAICDSAIFIKKKYYVLHTLDDEGVKVDKFKYKGVDVVKTTMPKAIKPYVKKIIETMINTQSLTPTNKAFMEAYEIYKGLSVEEIYTNMSVNNLEAYVAKCNGFETAKSMPAQLKRAYHHNLLLDKLEIAHKYDKFRSGDKIKMVYLKTPNRYGLNSIGFKGRYPKEFEEIFEIDYELMFGKILYAAIERFYDAVNWKLRKPNENVKIELEEFFA